MDKLGERLREDAERIPADVSDELSARIEASTRATVRAEMPARRPGFGFSLWWISSLTGAAAAITVIALVNRGDGEAPPTEMPIAAVVPDTVLHLQSEFPLRAETAVLTEPLEEELEKLKADLEKARDNVEADLKKSF